MHRAGVDNYITKMGKLRRLTPRECLRLMGFSDKFKICVSDTRMYQQAGNSIVSNILMGIIKNISIKVSIEAVKHLIKNSIDKNKIEKIYTESLEQTKATLKNSRV